MAAAVGGKANFSVPSPHSQILFMLNSVDAPKLKSCGVNSADIIKYMDGFRAHMEAMRKFKYTKSFVFLDPAPDAAQIARRIPRFDAAVMFESEEEP